MQTTTKIGAPEKNRIMKIAILLIAGLALCCSSRSEYHPEQTVPADAQLSDDEITTLQRQGRYGEAIPKARQALETREKALGPNHPDVAASLKKLAELHMAVGDYAGAGPLLKRALKIRENALGPDHTDTAEILNLLAAIHYHTGNYENAEPLFERTLAIWEKTYGPDHRNVAAALNNLAELYRILGKSAKAEPLLKRARAVMEKNFGPDHPAIVPSLNNLAALYHSTGKPGKAGPLIKKALSIQEKALGPDHPEIAVFQNNLAKLYKSQGDYAKAEPLFKRALATREKVFGADHPDVAAILDDLGDICMALGDYADAERLNQRSLEIWTKSFGPDHPNVAANLNNLGDISRTLGDYPKAERLLGRAQGILEKALGPDHPNVAANLNDMGLLHFALGNYAKAERLHRRSLAIRERAFGSDHPEVAASLNNLAEVYRAVGDHEEAETLYKRSLEIRKKTIGPDHPDVAYSLNSLAELYRVAGDYGKAEQFHKQSLELRKRALGSDHPYVAASLNNLALLYHSLGEYAEAESLFAQSLEIRKKTLGPSHPEVAATLNNLAELYRSVRSHDKLESLYKTLIGMWERALGPDHPNVATGLNNLALLYDALGDYAKAKPLFQRSLAIRTDTLGTDHPEVATSLHNLGAVHNSLGDYEKAEMSFEKSLGIWEKSLGPNHPNVSAGLVNLAAVFIRRGQYETAHLLMKRAQETDIRIIDNVMGFASEERKTAFLSTKTWELAVFLNLVCQHLREIPSSRKDALDIWLRRKGIILETQKRFQDALVYSDDPEAIETFKKLARLRTRLSKLVFAGPGGDDPRLFRQKIAGLENKTDPLEAKLSRISQSFALKKKIARADCERLAKILPDKSVLIEFARIGTFNFKAVGKEKKWGPDRYIAFVLHAGPGDRVGLVDLGEAGKIDKAILRYKERINVRMKKFARKVHDLVFAPLKKEIGDTREIFVSPDGNLSLIPFEVFMGPGGRYLIEDHTFNYLAAGRDLLGFGEIESSGEKAVIMGDPDYDTEAEEKESSHGTLGRSTDMRGFNFKRLPGTRQEAEAIHALLGNEDSELYTGKAAGEDVLRKKKAPRILHLATHGFFMSDIEMDHYMNLTVESADLIQDRMKPASVQNKIEIENPLLRSGIALAGANSILKSDDATDSDGIVTAEKVLGLRLRGTDMVVLSACETGLGEVKSGEGVYGLRRAFTRAGAKSLVMSMWAVPDRESKELMIEFYKNFHTKKMNRCQALRQAALAEMEIVKNRHGAPYPMYWGAFVFMGEPGVE